jgi:hypothetical protein
MAIRRDDFPLPDVEEPITAPFYAAAARNRLDLPRCAPCQRFVWYPQAECPWCGAAPEWTTVTGRATLFSWAVVRRAFLPAFADRVPFVTAVVALDEDPRVRLATLLVDVEAEALEPEMVLRATFRPLSFSTVPDREVIVPMFAPC